MYLLKFALLQCIFLLLLTCVVFSESTDTTHPVHHPVYVPKDLNTEALKKAVAPLMQMSLKEVVAAVPDASGIHFIGCPNCHGGEYIFLKFFD